MRAGILWTVVVLVGLTAQATPRPEPESRSANDLLRAVVDNELRAQAVDHSHWKYQAISKSGGAERKKQVIQTKEGDIDRVLAINGRPLSASEERREIQRIRQLVNHPEQQHKHQRDQEQDAQKTERLFKVLPEAVLASYGSRDGDTVELNYRPNPNFRPSSHEEQVFHAMEGKVWVNTKENRLAQIDGHLARSVKFGGGVLGHLDQGGSFQVRQTEVAEGHWEITQMRVNMKGKALFFKTISVQEDETDSGFQQVPADLTLAQGAAELGLRSNAGAGGDP